MSRIRLCYDGAGGGVGFHPSRWERLEGGAGGGMEHDPRLLRFGMSQRDIEVFQRSNGKTGGHEQQESRSCGWARHLEVEAADRPLAEEPFVGKRDAPTVAPCRSCPRHAQVDESTSPEVARQAPSHGLDGHPPQAAPHTLLLALDNEHRGLGVDGFPAGSDGEGRRGGVDRHAAGAASDGKGESFTAGEIQAERLGP